MKRKKKTEKKDTVKKKTKKNKKVSSTRMLINTKTITDYSLKLFNGEEVVFFVVQPQNLSVMSKENIGAKIFALTNVVKGLNDIEIICLNSRDNFEEKVLKADKPVILDLWASWCGPCKMLAPVVEELSEAHPEVLVGKVNVDEEPELADRFGVTAIPMLVLVKNGEVAKTAVGYQSRQQLEEALLG